MTLTLPGREVSAGDPQSNGAAPPAARSARWRRGRAGGDQLLKATAVGAVLLVAAIAAVVSYQHIYRLAVGHGQEQLTAMLIPFSVDGTVLAASLIIIHSARAHLGTPWLARAMLLLAVAATLAANIASGAPDGDIGMVVAGWPAVAFVGCVEICFWWIKAQAQAQQRARQRVPGVAAGKPASAGTERKDHGRRSATSSNGRIPGAVTAADVRSQFAEDLAAGRMPSARKIARQLHIHQRKAGMLRDEVKAARLFRPLLIPLRDRGGQALAA